MRVHVAAGPFVICQSNPNIIQQVHKYQVTIYKVVSIFRNVIS